MGFFCLQHVGFFHNHPHFFNSNLGALTRFSQYLFFEKTQKRILAPIVSAKKNQNSPNFLQQTILKISRLKRYFKVKYQNLGMNT